MFALFAFGESMLLDLARRLLEQMVGTVGSTRPGCKLVCCAHSDQVILANKSVLAVNRSCIRSTYRYVTGQGLITRNQASPVSLQKASGQMEVRPW